MHERPAAPDAPRAATPDTAGHAGQYLTFRIAGEDYGIGLLQVREIVEYGHVTPVPGTPAWTRGVINLRGEVVAVVDLAVKFGLPETQPDRFSCILVVETEIEGEVVPLGVIADSVRDVVDLGPAQIEPPPAFGTRVRVEYLLGLAKTGEGLAVLLDVQRVLSAEELLLASAAAETPTAAGDDAP